MTIQELIDKLKTFPSDTRVVVSGYEGGYNDISTIKEVGLKLNASKKWWDGQHDDSDDVNSTKAIALLGKNMIADN